MSRSTGVRHTDRVLLEAATTVFARAGFHAATVDAVAEVADTTKPTLYAHFGDKEALYLACVDDAAARFRDWLFEAYADSRTWGFEERVRSDTRAFFDFAAARPDQFRLVFRTDGPRAADERRQALAAEVVDAMTDRIHAFNESRGRAPWGPSARMCAEMVVGLCVRGAQYAVASPAYDPVAAGLLAASLNVGALAHLDTASARDFDIASEPARQMPAGP